MHKLAFVAITGLTVSAVCIGAAAAIGGKEFSNGMDISLFDDKPRCEAIPGVTATSRDLDWDGGDHVSINVPAHTQYSPSNGDKVHLSGDPQVIAHIRVRDGKVEADCHTHMHLGDDVITINLPGRQFRKFGIAGSGKMALEHLDQEQVKVTIAGSGSIKADGKVNHAEISIAGSGNADLSKVETQIVMVHIAGSGDTDIAPTDEADIHIAGSGNVNLHSNPKRIDTHIAGSGRIRNLGSGGI
ncbi:MAG TPA: DUF2807 domain-containing protein [Rhizomicrobium sp.]|jgi:hypothetical protein